MTDYAGDLNPTETWEFLKSNPNAIFVDLRTTGEWQQFGVPDTSSLDLETNLIQWVDATGQLNPDFIDDVRDLGLSDDPERPVVLLCRSGVRSVAAAKALTERGYTKVYNVSEGYEGAVDAQGQRTVNGWRNAGLPTTTI